MTVHIIIGADKPKNIREFTEQFVEALLTFWIARFRLDPDILPMTVIDVMSRLEEFLSNSKADLPSVSDSPYEMAMKIEESHILDRYIVNGDPVTSEKLALIAENVAMATAVAHWMSSEFLRSIEDLTDEGPDLK